MRYCDIRKNTYYDSVTLMLISSEINTLPGITQAAVMMGTAHNIQLMTNAGLLLPEDGDTITPNDLVVAFLGESEEALTLAGDKLKEAFENKKTAAAADEKLHAGSLQGALTALPDANLAVISVPGRFAAREARKALQQGMHVLLFSDNVSLEDEIALKSYAETKGLLMMGPDCGTAVINGTALGFANVVNRGSIGIAAASGTGLQELTCLIHGCGGGISQGLGTGGRDLKAKVGGKMMMMALEALAKDPETEVIGIIAKPGDPGVMKKIAEFCAGQKKPVAACFMGPRVEMDYGPMILTETIEDLARTLTVLSKGGSGAAPAAEEPEIDEALEEEIRRLKPGQRYLRGLYSGGTLAYEAALLMERRGIPAYSNIASDPDYLLQDPECSCRHTLLDMGEDYFTNGMPHPMIDMRLRAERMLKEASDPETAIILLDCVLGFGCHEDPAQELAAMTARAREACPDRQIIFLASVTGTDEDIQCRQAQVETLETAGIRVLPSNAAAVKLAIRILGRTGGQK